MQKVMSGKSIKTAMICIYRKSINTRLNGNIFDFTYYHKHQKNGIIM